ncbi:hypothetical protein [Pyxidicoccus xibeiensis]|uniref:hypothetical protein n=1 Tax=Pyxidicoccus xibeiensis TaxID=2906759 RepID=UPI0020A6FCA4|nr:hypothetical protein [Pyxidicoccus xibeiensis]MCP3142512.1 hypothetical protein [Pyxidicoccus xibeiensis]
MDSFEPRGLGGKFTTCAGRAGGLAPGFSDARFAATRFGADTRPSWSGFFAVLLFATGFSTGAFAARGASFSGPLPLAPLADSLEVEALKEEAAAFFAGAAEPLAAELLRGTVRPARRASFARAGTCAASAEINSSFFSLL